MDNKSKKNDQPQYSIIREQAGVPAKELTKDENARVNKEQRRPKK